MTNEDIRLKECLADKVALLGQYAEEGMPYVWRLRLSMDDYEKLERAIAVSIASHSGSHQHLISRDFALHVIIYIAEWYKRIYRGKETCEDAPVVELESSERKALWGLSGIDDRIFVYNASENEDKPSRRWKESMEILGGMAIRNELRRAEDDPMMKRLCKIYHGEDIDFLEVVDRNRAISFKRSIEHEHSLYKYIEAILKAKNNSELPFSTDDLANDPDVKQFIRRVKDADYEARQNKFDFEWRVSHSQNDKQMVRYLYVQPKPEEIGGKNRNYIAADRLSQYWDIPNPKDITMLHFFVQFKDGSKVIKKSEFKDPLIFLKSGDSFLSTCDMDNVVCTDIPVRRFTGVELVVEYTDQASGKLRQQVVQSLSCSDDYMQVYKRNDKQDETSMWTDRKNRRLHTAVIFSTRYKIKEEEMLGHLVYLPFSCGTERGEEKCWCPIFDVVTLIDENGTEIPFYNKSGSYQVVAKKYINTIRYKDEIFATYRYIDLGVDDDEDFDEADMTPKEMRVLFGREGLQVRFYPNGRAKEWVPVETYDLEYKECEQYNSPWKDWTDQDQPRQGKIKVRITVKNMKVFDDYMYYVPFISSDATPAPIWRNFKECKICFALEGQEDIQDTLPEGIVDIEETKQVVLGEPAAHVLLDVYRPVLLKELYQNDQLIEYFGPDDAIDIPLINCGQFTLKDFSAEGVRHYDRFKAGSVYYRFSDFKKKTAANKELYKEQMAMDELFDDVKVKNMNLYLTKPLDTAANLYAWDYKTEPVKVESKDDFRGKEIIFQSMKDDANPRHYMFPAFKIAKGFEALKKNKQTGNTDVLFCFETICEHKAYFLLFEPIVKCVVSDRHLEQLLFPLMEKRDWQLTDDDVRNLYRMGYEFHFDWMLLPVAKWKESIAEYAAGDDDKEALLRACVTDFFLQTPKATDEREVSCLKDFLEGYWTFNTYSTRDPLAEKAMKYIMGEIDGILKKNETWEDFLTQYDECRYKFSEMSRIYCINDNNE